MVNKKRSKLLALLIAGALLLSACATPTPEVIEKVVTQNVEKVITTVVEKVVTQIVKETVIVKGTPQVVEKKVTEIVEKVVTATPEPAAEEAAVGGTLIIAASTEPDTLDVHKSGMGIMSTIMSKIGASLVAQDPFTGEYVPYLAESWDISEDGLTWDFTLKKGVKFHDGTPLTAQDYAWSFNRATDPATQSPVTAFMLSYLASAEALDDYTLRLNLKSPSFPLMSSLSEIAYCSPLPQAAVEELGDQFGRQPISVGPWKFKEWKTGEKIVLERNPDYNWRPPFMKGGPYIQTIEYRFLPEYATIVAGLEAGELDLGGIESKDVQRIQDINKFQIIESVRAGMNPYIQINASKPPFDDLRVRKAFNLAVDRQTLIKVVTLGRAVEQRGPVTPATSGYWPGIEEIGYGYDLAQAQALMAEAGYVAGSDGILEKDGQPLELALQTSPTNVKVTEILQQQYKALGVDLEIEQLESSTLVGNVLGGEYQIAAFGFNAGEVDILVEVFGTADIGGIDIPKSNDSKLAELLAATRTTMDPVKRQEVVNAAMTHIVEQALAIPLYTPKSFSALSTRVKEAVISPINATVWLIDAYVK